MVSTDRDQPARPIEHVRLVGGDPALDFVNTVHDWYADAREDYLQDVPRFLQWCRLVGLLQQQSVHSSVDVESPARFLGDVWRLRDDLREVFLAVIEHRTPSAGAIAGFDSWLHYAWSDLTIDLAADGVLTWRSCRDDFTRPLKTIALSALTLLRSGQASRLKQCAAIGECGWLFVDDTKNGGRRWCSMDLCGSRAKMRRYRTTH